MARKAASVRKSTTTGQKSEKRINTPPPRTGAGMPARLTEDQFFSYMQQIPAEFWTDDGEPPGLEHWPPYPVTLATLSQMAGVSMTTIERWMKRSNFPKRDSDGLIDAMEVCRWQLSRDEGLKHRCRHCGNISGH